MLDEFDKPIGTATVHSLLAAVHAGVSLACSVEQLALDPVETASLRAGRLEVHGCGPLWAVVREGGRCLGVVTIGDALNAVREQCTEVEEQLRAILDSGMGSVFIADGEGRTVRVSRAFCDSCGVNESEVIGRHVRELEEEKLFYPSVTVKVLKNLKRESVVQDTRSGKKHLAVGVPVFGPNGALKWVVTASRDVTELVTLRKELEEAKALLSRYDEELARVRAVQSRVDGVVARSRAMQELVDLAQRLAQVDSTVLVLGESGVGKEVFAKMVHNFSARKGKPFLAINCGAIPDQLLESELFGYEPGAFTGATRSKPGLFELGTGGTIFLDEVAELPIRLQVKLLQVLQDRKIMRLGGGRPIPVDARIMAATNRDLEAMVRSGQFREDLFYRLNVILVRIPPLRERQEDIPDLACHFLERFNTRYGKNKRFAEETIQASLDYHWPGNVRELENVVERLAVTVSGDVIGPESLPPQFLGTQAGSHNGGTVVVKGLVPLREAISCLERQLLEKAVECTRSTYEAARLLGVDQSTVVRKYQKYFGRAAPQLRRSRHK